MCGIVGANKIPSHPSDLLKRLYHRGPDHQEYVCVEGNFFGHTRLAIIDLDSEADQPMQLDGLTLVFNGEIYNYEVVKEQEGLCCMTRSDTEIILRMYQKYGVECINYLEGMFSFALYDAFEKRWFCARDRFGKKPFYYRFKEGFFSFSSELKGVLGQLSSLPPLNIQAVWEYLAFQSPLGKNTFFEEVFKLPAGHYFTLDSFGLSIKQYYDIEALPIIHTDEAKIITDVDSLLFQAVQSRLVGDVDIAALLSGGLDSSLVSALYTRYSGRRIHTFSIGYDEHTHYCELEYARDAANYIGSEHHELCIDRNQYLGAIDDVLDYLDEPMSDSAVIPTYLISQFVHENGFKVCLSGEGADENFLGYNHYESMLSMMQRESQNSGIFSLTKEGEYLRRLFEGERVYRSAGETFTQHQLELLQVQKYSPVWSELSSHYEGTQWLTYIDFKIWIAEVLMTKVDRMSMAHSVEIRAPFLDRVLVEYMMGVEPIIKRGTMTKEVLKKVAKPYLPDSIIHRPKKGFSSPYIEWLYEGYGDQIESTILDVNKDLGIFDEKFVHFLVNEGKDGRFKQHVYALYLFAKWYLKVYR
jgi:asparagine synthase (glutamine-hydrolysing)